jgi:hypothetical protein
VKREEETKVKATTKYPAKLEKRDAKSGKASIGKRSRTPRQPTIVRGRPTKITKTLIKKIVRWVRDDSCFRTACRGCGISEKTGYLWQARGDKELKRIEAGEALNPGEALY